MMSQNGRGSRGRKLHLKPIFTFNFCCIYVIVPYYMGRSCVAVLRLIITSRGVKDIGNFNFLCRFLLLEF
jgi:hypothetical protein